jgi:hypothetical protein
MYPIRSCRVNHACVLASQSLRYFIPKPQPVLLPSRSPDGLDTARFGKRKDKPMDALNRKAITPSETVIGKCPFYCMFSHDIFSPTKISTAARP